MIFYLGTHMPHWLARVDVPLFVSRRTLERRVSLPRAIGRWALDSGGFSELTMHGEWRLPPREYVRLVRRYCDEIGGLDWAAPQDWMCEPHMLERTGLDVREHQRRTVDNLIELRMLAPDLPIIPVLQGWNPEDYADHVEQYFNAGIDLSRERVVGVGTVCRRQSSPEAVRVFDAIGRAQRGMPLHGFGFKMLGLTQLQSRMASSDSLAWSFQARKEPPLPECSHGKDGKGNCANCRVYALTWRDRLLWRLGAEAKHFRQPTLC